MTDTLVESEEYKGHKIEIHYDDSSMSPREWDNLTTIFAWHRKYNIGDDQSYNAENYDGWQELADAIKANYDVVAMYPLHMYDHGNIALSISDAEYPFTDPWDAGRIGFVVVTKERQEACGTPDELIEQGVRAEVQEYSDYLNGYVHGYVVLDDSGEQLDSCWGYIGDIDYCTKEARSIVDWYANRRDRQLVGLQSQARGS